MRLDHVNAEPAHGVHRGSAPHIEAGGDELLGPQRPDRAEEQQTTDDLTADCSHCALCAL
ncbi:MAG: hypothetical protein A3I79_06440 [Gemmatimonadetes bacterium RIFCSPLOWO2_02_FULL_71_11]|nr:MAG: hypothetical protein A3I79_06440 [Gemmatimonadetes bacterium RIFCSPLOWO2_02_FULL_71_11]